MARREGLEAKIAKSGGDVCVVDGPGLSDKVNEATGGVAIRLAIDVVAGGSTRRLADCVAEDGVVVTYGISSGDPCLLSPNDIIFRNLRHQGIWTGEWLQGRGSTAALRAAVYEELITLSRGPNAQTCLICASVQQHPERASLRGNSSAKLVCPDLLNNRVGGHVIEKKNSGT